jgi:hypothetical protein
MSGFPAGWTVADDSDGATAPGVLVASEDWWNCHLTTDEVRRVLAVEPHRSGKWTVTEGFVRRHPDGSTSPDDWPTVEFHATRDDALLAALCMARGTWSERCPEHGEEPVVVSPHDEVRWDCGRIVPGYRPAPRESDVGTEVRAHAECLCPPEGGCDMHPLPQPDPNDRALTGVEYAAMERDAEFPERAR